MITKETDKFKVTLENNRYFVVIIKEDVEMEVVDIQQLVEFQKILGGGKKYPVITLPSPTSTTNSDLFRYISEKNNLPYTIADAFVLTSVPHKILAKLYVRFSPPQRPTDFFTKREDAMIWLEKFME